MIVKNEEENLKKYLAIIKDFFDEIIIVDTGSTDKTLEIAKRFTGKVYQVKWNDNFSEARNYAIKKATKEWILFLDADEIITKEDFEKIRRAIKENIDAFRLNVVNYLNERILGAKQNTDLSFNYPFYISFKIVRLFKNKGYKYKYRVHELIEDSIEENNGVIKNLDVNIHHFGTLNLQNKKNDYYEKLVLKQLREFPDDKRSLYYAGKVFWSKKEYDKAISLFKKIKDESYKNIHAKIGQLYFAKKNLTKAISHYKKSLEFVKDFNQKAHLVNQLAFLYHRNNQDSIAKYLLKEFLKKNKNIIGLKEKFLLQKNLDKLT